MNGTKASYSFFLKTKLKEYPIMTLTLSLAFFVLVFAVVVQLFERGLLSIDEDPFMFAWNSMWLIILSMTTVGYGDIFPITHLGRVLTMISCISGTFIISLITVTLTNYIEFTDNERVTFDHILIEAESNVLKDRAATSITALLRFN